MRDKLVMKYQYPDDVEIAMDQFAADNPNAGWREFQREFERAMLRSMQPGGQLYDKFTPDGSDDRRR